MSNLDRLYAAIPPVKGCRLGCHDCCGPVPMSNQEAARVASPILLEKIGDMHLTPTKPCHTCAFSTPLGCSIYASRPYMCRLFGAVDDEPRLQCPHGAKADRPLSKEQAARLTSEYMAAAA